MLAFVGSPLTEHLARTPENFLICRGVTIARTAVFKPQQYTAAEIGISDSDELVPVYRLPEEVFSHRAMASGEGKPVTSPHPGTFVTSANANWYTKGHMQNVRQGDVLADGEIGLVADLVVTDEALADRVENGDLREVSLGYECLYVPREDGSFEQRRIVINHVAVVPDGRAGSSVRIQDSGEGVVNWKPINDRLDVLIDVLRKTTAGKSNSRVQDGLADDIVASSRRTEELMRSGVGPVAFHKVLAQTNQAYREFSERTAAGQSFSDACRAEGERQQNIFRPKGAQRDCRSPVTKVNDSEQDWAARVNAIGARMRG